MQCSGCKQTAWQLLNSRILEVVGRNCERPVQGERALLSELMSAELRRSTCREHYIGGTRSGGQCGTRLVLRRAALLVILAEQEHPPHQVGGGHTLQSVSHLTYRVLSLLSLPGSVDTLQILT